jgi:hypothetical protein
MNNVFQKVVREYDRATQQYNQWRDGLRHMQELTETALRIQFLNEARECMAKENVK